MYILLVVRKSLRLSKTLNLIDGFRQKRQDLFLIVITDIETECPVNCKKTGYCLILSYTRKPNGRLTAKFLILQPTILRILNKNSYCQCSRKTYDHYY